MPVWLVLLVSAAVAGVLLAVVVTVDQLGPAMKDVGAVARAEGHGQTGGTQTVGAASFVMPDEVGKNLQDAQDHMQLVSGNDGFYTGSVDATGQGRGQWLDRGWQVCNQNVAPGTRVSADDTGVVFSVVRVTESCQY